MHWSYYKNLPNIIKNETKNLLAGYVHLQQVDIEKLDNCQSLDI